MLEEVGRVVALLRYPVKSMAAEALDGCDVGWNGLAGDRRWTFIRGDMKRSGFPWMTIREQPAMWHYRPRFVDPSNPNASAVLVRTPDGRELDTLDPALAEELGPGVHVMKQDRGVFDATPLSLITTRTIARLSAEVGVPLGADRFRPNLVVEPADDVAGDHPENDWVGRELEIGGMRMRVDRRDKRCVMVNVDPVTTEKNAAVLRAIAQRHDACLGVYGTVVAPGRVEVGASVRLAGASGA